MSKKRYLLSVIMCLTLSTGVNSGTLREALSRYCVPTTASNCVGIVRARYNDGLGGNNKCECGRCNMYYDKNSRLCRECPVGTYVNNRSSTECIVPSCGIGHYSEVEVGKNECPRGYYKEVFSRCK